MMGVAPPPEGDTAAGHHVLSEQKEAAAPTGRALHAMENVANDAPVALEVQGLRALGDRGTLAVHDLSLAVRAGEILGVAGVSGNGQRELVEALVGQRPRLGGRVTVMGQPYNARRAENRELKVRSLPEEPLRNACVGDLSVAENMALRDFDRPPLAFSSRGGVLNFPAWRSRAREWIAEYGVKTQGEGAPIRSLSGGNVQRAVLARELAGEINVLIAANPVFGLDFAAVAEIHQPHRAGAREGRGGAADQRRPRRAARAGRPHRRHERGARGVRDARRHGRAACAGRAHGRWRPCPLKHTSTERLTMKISADPFPYEFEVATTALVLIDMQRDFIEPGGFGETLGNNVALLEAIVPATKAMLQAWREAGGLVVHTREAHKADLSDCPPAKLKRGNPSLRIGDAGPMGRILIAASRATRSSTRWHPWRARSSSTSPARACSTPPPCTRRCRPRASRTCCSAA